MQSAKIEENLSTQGITQDKGRAVKTLFKQEFGDQRYLEDQFGWYFEILRDFIVDSDDDVIECNCGDEGLGQGL